MGKVCIKSSDKTNNMVSTNDGCRNIVYLAGGMTRMGMNDIVTGRKTTIGNNNAIVLKIRCYLMCGF